MSQMMRLEHYSPKSKNIYKVKKSALGKSKSTPTLGPDGSPQGGDEDEDEAAIFQKLTDPTQYTGTHTHRFDDKG